MTAEEKTAEEETAEKDEPKLVDVETIKEAKGVPFSKSFYFEWHDEESRPLVGTFTCKRLTLGDLTRFGVIKTHLNGGDFNSVVLSNNLSEMIAFCRVALVKAPDWFVPEDMYSMQALESVYNYVKDWHQKFRG